MVGRDEVARRVLDVDGRDGARGDRGTPCAPPPGVPATFARDAIGDEPIYHAGKVIGWVTSGGYGHTVGKSLALGYVDKAVADETTYFAVELMGDVRGAVRLPEPAFDPSGARMRA